MKVKVSICIMLVFLGLCSLCNAADVVKIHFKKRG